VLVTSRTRRRLGLAVAVPVAAMLAWAPATPAAPRRVIPEPLESAGFLTYAELQQDLATLQAAHPDLMHVVTVGTSAGGHPVLDVIVTNFKNRTPLHRRTGILFNGSIHGDERDGAEGFARIIEDLVESTSRSVRHELDREVVVFTFANPDGWVHGDVPGGLEESPGAVNGGEGPGLYFYSRWNDASHDLNREWPVVGFQNETSFPLVDPEVRSLVEYNGNYLHRTVGIRFAYAFDVHGSAETRTPPQSQLMLDILMGADQMNLARTQTQVRLLTTYLQRLHQNASADPLHELGATTDDRIYTPGEWDTTWDIYGYQVSGDYADWMANSVTGLGAVADTVELWANGEPGQENTFAGYDPLVEASNVQSLRVLAATAMDLASRPLHPTLHLPGPVAFVTNRTVVRRSSGHGSTKPVGPAATRPPTAHYPVSTNAFFRDLARAADRPVVALDAGRVRAADLRPYAAVVVAQDPHLDSPAFLAALAAYARSGGRVVLTDAALRDLSGLKLLSSAAVGHGTVYAGYVTPAGSTPLTRGARPLSGQTYEPVPLGYEISNTFSSSTSVTTAPAWWVDSSAWQRAGGSSDGTTGSGHTSLGALPVGRGKVIIIGSLLPDPSAAYTHPFGLDSYDLTYWGYQLLENALGASVR
jgi:predicted deacylase